MSRDREPDIRSLFYLVVSQPKFEIGQLAATPNALESLEKADIEQGLSRHIRGDWGDIDEEDRETNDRALVDGARLLSAYKSADGKIFWIITEADRSVTTVLMPEDY